MKTTMRIMCIVLLMLGVTAIGYAQYPPQPAPPPPASTPRPPAPTQPGSAAMPKADILKQVKTAATHATFASKGGTLSYSRLHLGHALNCLEGPRGKNFNAAWGNVCEGMGNGILVDLRTVRNNATLLGLAQRADVEALKGVRTASLTVAKAQAKRTADLLNQIDARLR